MRTKDEIREIIKFSEHYLDEICLSEEDKLLMEAYIDALKWVLESGNKEQQEKTLIKEIFAICKNCPDTTIECSGCCPKKHKKLKDILEVIESENKDDTSKQIYGL